MSSECEKLKDGFERKMCHLRRDLQTALEVEHATIPPYLCALYSIREGTNLAAASVIQSVVMEEMLHMVLVANLLNAVGGEPRLDYEGFVPSYPSYLPGSDRSFVVPLGKLSPEALEVFMRIEKPEPPKERPHPEEDGFSTIGEFYATVRQHLSDLVRDYGAEKVFCGKRDRQVTTEYYYGGAGEVFPVECLKSAGHAIDEIVEQGEGAHGGVFEADYEVRGEEMMQVIDAAPDQLEESGVAGVQPGSFHHTRWSGEEEPAHYYRYLEIYEGRYFQKGDTPATGPRGPELPVQWDAVYNMRPNPHSNDYPADGPIRKVMDDFNRVYSRLLRSLQAGFNGQQEVLVNAVADMYELKDHAVALMRTPSGHGDTTVGPSFEYMPAD